MCIINVCVCVCVCVFVCVCVCAGESECLSSGMCVAERVSGQTLCVRLYLCVSVSVRYVCMHECTLVLTCLWVQQKESVQVSNI